jgi:hypothetical protein
MAHRQIFQIIIQPVMPRGSGPGSAGKFELAIRGVQAIVRNAIDINRLKQARPIFHLEA